MKNFKKVLIAVLSVMLFVCMGLFAVACDKDEPDPVDNPVYYTVTVAEYDETRGTVTLDPVSQDGKYEKDASVTVVATPKTNYEVDSVKVNGSALTASGGKYVFTVSGDSTVAVTFKSATVTPPAEDKVSVTLTCGENGSASLDPAPVDGKVAKGASLTLTATPNANYEVDSVKVNGTAVNANADGKYVFTVNADTTVSVTFKATSVTPPAEDKVNVNVTCCDDGVYTLDPAPVDGKVAKGASVKLTVTPNENYEVDSVKVNGSAVNANAEGKYVFTADSDVTVEVSFKPVTVTPPAEDKVNVNVTCGDNGSYTLDPAPVDGKVAKGASLTLTVTANADYEVDSVKVNGSAVTAGADGKYTFTADDDTTVEITFKSETVTPPPTEEKVNVTLTCGEHGSATLDPAPVDGKVAKGASVKLTVTPNENYEVDSVKVNDTAVTAGEDGKYTFTADDDTTVEVTFKASLVSLTLTCGEHGSAALDPAPVDGKVAKGTSVKLTVTPAANYEVDSVKVGDADVQLTDGEYAFTVTADTAVEVSFKVKQVSVTATYTEGQGSVTLDPAPTDGKVVSGTALSATIEPAYGYEIVSVTVNGTDVTSTLEELYLDPRHPDRNMRDHSPKRSLDLGAVTEDTELAVTFQAATHSVTVNVTGPGTYTLYNVSVEPQSELKTLTAVSSATKVHVALDVAGREAYVSAEVRVNDGTETRKLTVAELATDFWVVNHDLTVTVTFTVDPSKAPTPQHSVTVTGGENGTVTVTPKGDNLFDKNIFYEDGEATVTLAPDTTPDKYIIGSLTVKYGDGEATDVTADLENGSYTFPVTGDVELQVSFKKFEKVTPTSTYRKTWYCTVKGESATTNLSITVTNSSISIKEGGVTKVSGTPYTATFGYTIYAENLEDTYEIYVLPELKNRILALTVNGDSVTYYANINGTLTSDRNATIEETHSLYDSSWTGGPASMPIKFEFGEVYVDTYKAARLAKSETDEGLVYTVYVNGGLYDLIYTETERGESLVLHPYGKSTKDDVTYTRETPPDPVLVPDHAGTYSNNEHEVYIDAEGNFEFDGTTYNLYKNTNTNDYYFKTTKLEYTVVFQSTGSIMIFNAAASVDWTLKKITEDMKQYLLTVNCPDGTFTLSPKNDTNLYWEGSSVTITITPKSHFEVETITVNDDNKTFTSSGGKITITVTVNEATTVEVTCKEFKEGNLLSDLYQGTYKGGNYTTVTITASGVTVKDTYWGVSATFTDAQITCTGEGHFLLEQTTGSKRKFEITFSADGTIKLIDSKSAIGGSKTLTKQS